MTCTCLGFHNYSKLFEVLETYYVCPLVRQLLYNMYSRSECMCNGTPLILRHIPYTME